METKELKMEEIEVAGSDSGTLTNGSLEYDSVSQASEEEHLALMEDEVSRAAAGRKTFDLVVPPPISTSGRAFSTTRPVSMSLGSTTSSPRKTSNTGPGTPKKWVVNVPPPLAGFSSSPSAQSRLTERLSTRFDSSVLAQLNFGPLARAEASDLPATPSAPKDPENEAEPSISPRIELHSSDSESGETPNGGIVAQPATPNGMDHDLSEPILHNASTLSMASETSLDESAQSEPVLSPRSKPQVPAKSAALLERRKEKQRTKPVPEVASPTAPLSPSGHKPAPPPVPRRKSGYFEKGTIFREPGSKESSNGSSSHTTHTTESNPEEMLRTRTYLAQELLKTETFYVRSMRTIVEKFLTPMRESLATDTPILPPDGQKQLFSNIEMILKVHEPFEAEVQKTVSAWGRDSKVGPLLLGLAPYLRIYMTYINNYNKSMQVYQEGMKHKSFRRFIADASVGNDLDNWPSYCIQPVQRILKYMLILSEMVKNTPDDHPDYEALKKAHDTLGGLATEMNTQKKDAEALTACAHIQSRLSYPDGVSKLELVTQTRRYCREGQFDVFLNGIATPYNYLVLFNDALLITKSKRKHLRFDGFLLLQHTQIQTFESIEFDASSPPPTPHGENGFLAPSGSSAPDDTPTALKRKSVGPIPQSGSSSSLAIPSSPSSSTLSPLHGHHHGHQHHASHTGSPSSSAAPIATTSSHSGVVHSTSLSLTFRSLVLPVTVVVIFHNLEDFINWKQEASLAASKHDTIPIPDVFPDRVVSAETNMFYSHSSSNSNAASTAGNNSDTPDDSVAGNSRKSGSQSLGSSRSKHRLRRLLTIGSKSKKDASAVTSSAPAGIDAPSPSDSTS